VQRVLKPGGKILIDITDGEYLMNNYSPRSWEWIDKNCFVCRERSLSFDKMRLISREVIMHLEKGLLADQFYAERLYTGDSLKDLLQKANFYDVQITADVKTESERNQDLGMMERRIILSSEAIKEWSPEKHKAVNCKNVVVLLGDPNKKDVIKPDNVFDDDDYNTIEQLKIALSALKEYKFTYLTNHDTLLSNLSKLKAQADYVLNLCDEGFDNDARNELHIPALLEMLKIPYTGSNPQCLAYCYDKSLIRGIAKEMDVPVANAFYIKP
jgi:D-alanine-D-alanine ligase